MIHRDIKTLADLPFHVAERFPLRAVTDLAVLAAGGVTVAVYPTLASGQVRYILHDCAASLAIVSNRAGAPPPRGGGHRWRTVIEQLYGEGERSAAGLTT